MLLNNVVPDRPGPWITIAPLILSGIFTILKFVSKITTTLLRQVFLKGSSAGHCADQYRQDKPNIEIQDKPLRDHTRYGVFSRRYRPIIAAEFLLIAGLGSSHK